MSRYDWRGLLTEMSQEVLAADRYRQFLPPEVVAAGWLGYPGATNQQIVAAEARLGTTLPPSYREFLQVSNGWRITGHFIPRLWSTEEVEWFAVRHQGTIAVWTREPMSIPDEQYFAYGDETVGAEGTRPEYLRTALDISDVEPHGTAILLLNPRVVTPDGEWEAWFFAHWVPGAERYRSFWKLMQAEHANFLE